MFHPHLGPIARLTIALAVLAPSLAAGYGTWYALSPIAPQPVAAFPAALIAIIGIITITHGIETLLNRRQGSD